MVSQNNSSALLLAIEDALNGKWDAAHQIAQSDNDNSANWLHAVLHKIEGDEWNSKYWYARTSGHQYEDFTDAVSELLAIRDSLKHE